ncbi:MAG: hypothetical protein NTW75_07920 [Planctomycetales bacterium]|nr:hypothetical protein [Planctomycetales bacterium]
MKRYKVLTASCCVVLTALMLPTSRAAELEADSSGFAFVASATGVEEETIVREGPILVAGDSSYNTAPAVISQSEALPISPVQPRHVAGSNSAPPAAPLQAGYPQLNAPLYPSPRPNIPSWTGSTMITNQAFAPHEMLYPHTYRAIYPPFYHRVKGKWIVTPFGVRSHEHWELQGTQVQVKYRSQYPGLLHGAWHPPMTSHFGGRGY